MNKNIERLKKHLLEIAEAVNAFDSEAVQVKVISRVISAFQDHDDLVTENHVGGTLQEPLPPHVENSPFIAEKGTGRKPGLTKIIQEEIKGDYFQTARNLAEITDYLAGKHESKFYTYQTSGILLGLVRKGQLNRETDPVAGGYIYLLPTEQK